MRKIAAVIISALALVGCATVNNPVGKQGLAEMESIYGIALSSLKAYQSLPRCAAGQHATLGAVCAEKSVIIAAQNANRIAYSQVIIARNFVKNNPTLDASVLISTAMQSVVALRNIETTNGMQ